MVEKKQTMVSVTDEAEQEELLRDHDDIGKPYPHKPNGHIWVDADELKAWREGSK